MSEIHQVEGMCPSSKESDNFGAERKGSEEIILTKMIVMKMSFYISLVSGKRAHIPITEIMGEKFTRGWIRASEFNTNMLEN